MKRRQKWTAVLLLVCVTAGARANQLDVQFATGISDAGKQYDAIREQLDQVVGVLEKDGLASLQTNTLVSMTSTFVIDPKTGQILLGEAKNEGAYAHINGRSIAQGAIRHWQDVRDDDFFEQAGLGQDLYRSFYSSLAVTLDGDLYVVTVGRREIELEKSFISRLIDRAGALLQEEGPDAAIKRFADTDGEFRTKYTYLYVYDEDGRCLFNPNYPELVGKTSSEMEPGIGGVVREFLALANENGGGWLRVSVRNPITKSIEQKELFVKRFLYNGRYFTVGSGVYEAEP